MGTFGISVSKYSIGVSWCNIFAIAFFLNVLLSLSSPVFNLHLTALTLEMVVKTPRNFKVKRRISFKLSKETLGLIFKVINANLYHQLAVLTPFRFPGSRRRDHGPRSQEGRAASEGGTSPTKEELAPPRHLGDAGRLPLTQKPARGHWADHQGSQG